MAQAYIYADEAFYTMIFPVGDNDYPQLHTPVEIPDALLALYMASVETERALRHAIIIAYGESPANPNYEEEWGAFVSKTTSDAEEEHGHEQ